MKNTVSQHLFKYNNNTLGGEGQLSMEGVVLDYFKNGNIIIEVDSSSEFYSYHSEDNTHDAPVTHAHMVDLYQNLMRE